jgi:hypothetical protein
MKMDMKELNKTIDALEFEQNLAIYDCGNSTVLSVFRPKIPTKTLKHKYDPKKNFQIYMEKNNQKFKPNHLRILLDLHLKRITNEEKSSILFEILEDIYDGEDPTRYKTRLNALDFPMFLDNAYTNACLAQLFMTEQDINQQESWKVKPARAYIMGYIRLINAQEREISWVLWSATRHAPRKEYITPPKMRNSRLSEF